MKTVLITGIGKGIGKALADKFLSEGWFVLGSYLTTKPIERENLLSFSLDLSSTSSIEKFVEEVKGAGKEISILLNNAGVLIDDEETRVVMPKLRETLEINLFGTIDLTERLFGSMSLDGHVVNVSSSAGSLARSTDPNLSHYPYHHPAYKISKAALNMYTRTLASSLKNEGSKVVVSSVHPGWAKTEMGGEEAPMTPEEAAEEVYTLAVSKVETGQFWSKGKKFDW